MRFLGGLGVPTSPGYRPNKPIKMKRKRTMKEVLKRCKQCGFENFVKKSADKCPQCGGRLKSKSIDLGFSGTLIFLLVLAGVISFFVFYGKLSEKPQIKLKIANVELEYKSSAKKRNDHELIVCFNRPLTKEELDPGPGYTLKYGMKYYIESISGWKRSSYSTRKVQSGLTIRNKKCYLLLSESSFHPLRGNEEETDKNFRKENISEITIELYECNKTSRNSNYRKIDTYTTP